MENIKEIVAALEETKSRFLADAKVQADAVISAKFDELSKKFDNIKGLPESFDPDKVNADMATLVKDFDELAKQLKEKSNSTKERKTFGKLLMEGVQENFASIEKAMKEKGTYVLNLKEAGVMTIAASLTGDGVATYAANQAILPAQAINLRDLFPTTYSPTGLYVQYKESGGEGSPAKQTEGQTKAVVDYDLTEVKTVSNYVAGQATFSKQLMKVLPFFEGTLSRMLLRDFYKAENALGFAALAAGTGVTTHTATDDVEELIQLIANQKTANFQPSIALVSHKQMARLVISTYGKGYYAGAGMVQIAGQGLNIWGVPVVSASWVTDDKVAIVDAGYFERVETEGLNVVFSFEHNENFTKNLVTARIECMEEWNLMLPTAAIYADLGNVS